jgi:phosphatidylinositol alpha-1,6-mannosyltransferase
MVDIRKRVGNVLYAIVGEGEERPALERLVAGNGLSDHVQFLGEIDDAELVRCYQQCDLFVLPNRDIDGDVEGFGMVLVEAQACGKPVIGGASGGTADTMKIPETGRLVCCDEWEALAQVVSEVLCDAPLRAAMGEAARHWAVEQFSWDSLSRKAQELFQTTMESPRTR